MNVFASFHASCGINFLTLYELFQFPLLMLYNVKSFDDFKATAFSIITSDTVFGDASSIIEGALRHNIGVLICVNIMECK